MMDEYIKREDVIKHLRGACIAKYPLSFSYGIFASADEISKLPPSDVVPKSEVEKVLDEVESLFYKVDLLDELGCASFEIGLDELKKKYTEGTE